FPGGQPLKGRENLVLTRQNISVPGATVVHSEQEAVEASARYDRCLVIGGASVYRQMMPWVDTVHITKIDLAPPSDSFFPNLDASPDWTCAEEGPWQEENGVRYCFCTYRRNPCKEETST
ncbi:MAG: dihydrofolate reductase, partial [Oscillospiraceae bacterium]|nr:dihydrofolate reductase [Oscillospiraceae bacterium]